MGLTLCQRAKRPTHTYAHRCAGLARGAVSPWGLAARGPPVGALRSAAHRRPVESRLPVWRFGAFSPSPFTPRLCVRLCWVWGGAAIAVCVYVLCGYFLYLLYLLT